MKKSKESIVEYIHTLKGYEGYVQFSNSKIRIGDIFKGYQDIELEESEGFVYEAHFFNGSDSISIKQLNGDFYVDEERTIDMSEENTNVYQSKVGEVQMVQLWESKPDPLCEGMYVKKCKKVVFAGFVNGGL